MRKRVLLVPDGMADEPQAALGGRTPLEAAQTPAMDGLARGGIGQNVSNKIKELAPKYNGGKKIDMISMNLSYLVRSGAPDAIDCIVPTAYGNLAVDLILKGETGRMVALAGGRYGSVPIEEVVSTKKVVDVARCYDTERYRPKYDGLAGLPLMVLGGSA